MAVYAKVGLLDRGRVITLGVESGRNLQDIPRAELDAVPASLAPVFYDMDNPLRDEDFFRIQGNSPKFHFIYPLPKTERFFPQEDGTAVPAERF
jgi:hypothetical protein